MMMRQTVRGRSGLRLLGTTGLFTALALPAAASAQEAAAGIQLAMADPQSAPDAAAATTEDPAASSDLGAIVVTATRSAENMQRVPISIQALATETLSERNIVSFTDYVNMLPSVSFSTLGPGRTSVFFRGISVSGGNFSTVGTYLDEIPITTAGRMPDVHVYDVARVEALSGPQGTLFGASSLAGTIRIITNKPDSGKFEAGYDVQVNKYGKGDAGAMFEGFVNIPVHEDIAVRLMGFYRSDGGYIDNVPASLTYQLGDDDPNTTYTVNNARQVKDDFNTVEEYGGRLAIGIDLDENWTVTPAITAQYLNAKGSFNYDPRFGDLVVHDFFPTYNKDKWYQAALTIEGKIGDFDVISATGYFRRKILNANDYTYYTVTYDSFGPGYESYLKFEDASGDFIDPTQQYFGRFKQMKFTQEVRISTPKDWPFHLTLGGFYQKQKNENNGDYFIEGLAAISQLPANLDKGQPVKRDAFYLVENDQTYKDSAIFAEGSVNILDSLKLTAGIRGFKVNNLIYGFGGVAGSARSSRAYDVINQRPRCTLPLPDQRLTCINTNIPFKEKGETHKINLTWQVTPDHMVYATYSTGFRPGGGNRIAPNNPFKADKLTNYELGFKTTWNNMFRLNGAVYYEDWSGLHYSVVPYGFQGAGVTVNAGKARVYGVEMDATLALGGFTIAASGAYNDAALSEDLCKLGTDLAPLAACPLDEQISAKKGTRLPRQPKLKLQASVRYEWELGNADAYLQGVGYYQTSSTSNLDTYKNFLLGNTPGFASFDFSAGAKLGNKTVEFFIQNIFDKRGQLSKNTFCSIEYCSDSSRTFPIKPQFFGLRFGQRF